MIEEEPRVGFNFSTRYRQSRIGGHKVEETAPNEKDESYARRGGGSQSSMRLSGSFRSNSSLFSNATAPVRVRVDADTEKVPGKHRPRRIDDEKRMQLNSIRNVELQNPGETLEQSIPRMPMVSTTFNSNAHLRTDAYWGDLLGQNDEVGRTCRWADSVCFRCVVGVTIGLNALLLAGETSSPSAWLLLLEHSVYVFSIFELCISGFRIYMEKPLQQHMEVGFFILDSVAVIGCLIENWGSSIIMALGPEHEGNMLQDIGTTTRLLWLTRFVKVVRIMPALRKLVRGITQALVGLLWVFVFVFGLIFTLAVLFTNLIGEGELERFMAHGRAAGEEAVSMEFSDVGSSMFVLFNTMTSWSLMPLIPLFEAVPATRLSFCIFYVFVGWTLLAVLTGTVSFTMIAMKAQMAEDEERAREEEQRQVQRNLREMFETWYEDADGLLSWQEFKLLLQRPDAMRLVAKHSNLEAQDVELLWSFLDVNNTSTLCVDQFMEGLQWFGEPFRPKTLMKLQGKLGRNIRDRQLRLVTLIKKRFDLLIATVDAPLKKLHAVTEQVQIAVGTVAPCRASLESRSEPTLPGDLSPCNQELDFLETTISDNITEVLARLAGLEVMPYPVMGSCLLDS